MTDAAQSTNRGDLALAGLMGAGWLCCHALLADLSRLASGPGESLDVAMWGGRFVSAASEAVDMVGSRLPIDMAPVQSALFSFGEHTVPRTWGEAAVKAHLAIGAGQDLVRLTRQQWPAPAVELLGSVQVRDVQEALERVLLEVLRSAEEQSRLSSFGRRVIAEGTAQAQRIAARRPELAGALVGVDEGSLDELSGTTQLVADLVEGAAQRMLTLGLQP